MRVLVLTNMYPPHHYGGYELNCLEFVEWLVRAGDDVLVLTSDVTVPSVDPAAGDPQHGSVRRELQLYWRDHEIVRVSVARARRVEQHNQAVLARAIEDHRPDLVSVWAMGAMSLGLLTSCRRRGLPLVHVVNEDWPVYGPLVDSWSRRWRRVPRPVADLAERLLGLPCRPPDLPSLGAYCFITDTTRRTAEAHAGDFPLATVAYCGINTDDFPVGGHALRSRWGWRLLHVGRIDDRKGIDTAIRVLARLPESATLDVLGRGDDRHLDQLRTLAGELGVGERVTFDVVERSELGARYAAADVLLFLPRWAEPFGLVPIEAMACSTPVVATGTGGSSEFLVDGVNCLRVAPDDVVGTADAVRRLADEARLREALVAGGHVTANELTLDRWFDVLEAWHRAAVAGYPHGAPAGRQPIATVLAALRSGDTGDAETLG